MGKTVLYLFAASLELSSYTINNDDAKNKKDKQYSLAEEHTRICPRLLKVINGWLTRIIQMNSMADV